MKAALRRRFFWPPSTRLLLENRCQTAAADRPVFRFPPSPACAWKSVSDRCGGPTGF